MKIKKIEWISNDIYLDAIVLVSDGSFEIKCFCSNCVYSENEILNDRLYAFEIENVRLSLTKKFDLKNINNTFEYYIVGELINQKLNIIRVGEIFIELFQIPNDITEGQFIEFYCKRIDIY